MSLSRLPWAVLLAQAGCSAVGRINDASASIQTEARALQEHGEATGDATVVDGAGRILDLAQGIQADIDGVRDAVPAWLSTAWMLGAAALAIAICVILWQTGLGTAIRSAIGWIPQATRRRAALAADMMDESRPESAREYVAAQRSSDPLFDRAFTQARQRRETPSCTSSHPSTPSSGASGSPSSSAVSG